MHNGSSSRKNVLFCLVLIPLCLSIGSLLFVSSGLIGYIEERYNEKIYLNTTCFLNGTIRLNERCKDDICWWPISSGLCPSTFRLCLKSIYVIIYGNNQKAYTDTRPSWTEDDQINTICYYDKTKSGIIRWKKAKTKDYLIEILFGTLIFVASIILWIVWIHLQKLRNSTKMNNKGYRILSSEY